MLNKHDRQFEESRAQCARFDRQFEESRAQCARFSPSNIGRIDFACNFRDCQFVESRKHSARDLRTGDHALFNTRVYADRKNMHAALLRFLAYFLTIQLDENITR